MSDRIDSTSDDRTANNVARHEYRVLTDDEKAAMQRLKDLGAAFVAECRRLQGDKPDAGRELALGATNAEQAVMWAVKGLTK